MITTLYQNYKLNNLDTTDEDMIRDVNPRLPGHGTGETVEPAWGRPVRLSF
jgi:hypothetical protein